MVIERERERERPTLERPLDTEEAQSYEQSMLAEFAKEHEKAETSSAA